MLIFFNLEKWLKNGRKAYATEHFVVCVFEKIPESFILAAIRLADGVNILTNCRTLMEPVRSFWEKHLEETGQSQRRSNGRWNVAVAQAALSAQNPSMFSWFREGPHGTIRLSRSLLELCEKLSQIHLVLLKRKIVRNGYMWHLSPPDQDRPSQAHRRTRRTTILTHHQARRSQAGRSQARRS